MGNADNPWLERVSLAGFDNRAWHTFVLVIPDANSPARLYCDGEFVRDLRRPITANRWSGARGDVVQPARKQERPLCSTPVGNKNVPFGLPFFKDLGWDVDNIPGYAEAYKDVIHEDALRTGGVTKAPDCSFRIDRLRKFFLEAKKPAVHLKDDPAPGGSQPERSMLCHLAQHGMSRFLCRFLCPR
jgi:hypothetical protein